MKKAALIIAAVLLATSAAYSAERGAMGRGASENTPGDTMQDKDLKGHGGASQFTPGHEQKRPGGASELSPGDRMNDRR
jgi:hypothetical protein